MSFMMTEELSGVTIVIIIAGGVMTCLMLFIFAKRQIMRFTLRSRRGPHFPIGHDIKKSLKREIERRIDLIPKIVYEPELLTSGDDKYILYRGQQLPSYYYRLKAVDDVKLLQKEIAKQDPCLIRHPTENLRAFLLTTLAAPLNGTGQRLIHQFCDFYEQARHDPNEFGDEEYQAYNRLLLKLLDAAKLLKSFNSRKSSPNRTPQRLRPTQLLDKNRSLLDPSRLRPPNIYGGVQMPIVEDVLTVTDNTIETRPTTLSVHKVPPTENGETSV
ncbi:protein C1orf43 homolog [Chrysoperla carnea]|uniref:protein C1orf43 homolog n=1 Tax=Chrysoperla carnea TaxID=189513 RepID=UPI001D072118|nr:protein C1orf43 homolog [Chrysoperla carnea]